MVPTTTEKSQKPTEQETEKDSAAAKATLLDLFRPKKILWRTICMFYNWMVMIILHTYNNFDKGQIISKANYGILNSSKKRTNKFDFTTMIPQVVLFSFGFWRKLKPPKTHLEIN